MDSVIIAPLASTHKSAVLFNQVTDGVTELAIRLPDKREIHMAGLNVRRWFEYRTLPGEEQHGVLQGDGYRIEPSQTDPKEFHIGVSVDGGLGHWYRIRGERLDFLFLS